MRALIDTVFNPVLNWLNKISSYILHLSVPVARPLDISQYLGPFALLGPYWISFITTVCALAFIYMVCFIIVASQGTFIKWKDTIKWW
jgi:hypothetical protein